MLHIVQKTIFAEEHFNSLVDTLFRMGLDYEIVRFIPFEHDVEMNSKRKDIWPWGGVNMAHLTAKYQWKPGSMFNENHDFAKYGEGFGMENMLNGEGVCIDFTEEVPLQEHVFFARPTLDSKLFSGQPFTIDGWKGYVNMCKENGVAEAIQSSTKILVAPLKEIQQEVRCWIVGGKVVTASRYKLGQRVSKANYDNESFFVDFAQKMAEKYQPAEAFVLDICLSMDQLKIVEVNCINCSGFYHCDIQKLIVALEKHFE